MRNILRLTPTPLSRALVAAGTCLAGLTGCEPETDASYTERRGCRESNQQRAFLDVLRLHRERARRRVEQQ